MPNSNSTLKPNLQIITTFFLFQHLYPKSQIDIFITVLENDGSVLASSITCAGLALINASIHVFDVIIGSSIVSMILWQKLKTL